MRSHLVAATVALGLSALLGGCVDGNDTTSSPTTSSAVESASASPTTEGSASTTESAAPETPVAWPAEVPYPVEGPAWVVYVAVAEDSSQPERDRVWAAMEQLRGTTPYVSARGAGSVGCENGAADALGLDPATFAAPVFLASEAEAQQFAERWGGPVVGPAPITEDCIA
jgi:hypothetical protein